MRKIAVHLHLYYLEQLPIFLKKLASLDGTDYDLFVTMVEENKEAESLILKFKPKAKIWIVENRGYDIAPFIYFLHQINLDDYELVIKLHTKNQKGDNTTILNGFRTKPFLWCTALYDSLLGSKDRVSKNLDIFAHQNKVGMIGSCYCITSERFTYEHLLPKINNELRQLKFKPVNQVKFVAGTMFMVRAELLKPFLAYQFSDFSLTEGTAKDGTLSHVLERLFGIIIESQGYTLEKVKNKNLLPQIIWNDFKLFCYQKKYTKTHHLLIKIFRLPLLKLKQRDFAKIKELDYTNTKILKTKPHRIAVFAFYNAEGIIHDYVITYLKYLNQVCDAIILYGDCKIYPEELSKIKSLVMHASFHRHEEYDFGSYKRGYLYAQQQNLLSSCEQLVFCNDSCFCIDSLKPVFSEMSSRNVDFWGMTENVELEKHLQSYFWVFNRNVFLSDVFQKYIASIKHCSNFWDIVKSYEIPLTSILANDGKSYSSFVPILGAYNPTSAPLSCMIYGMPLIKRKVFSEEPYSKQKIVEIYKHVVSKNHKNAEDILESFGIKTIYTILFHMNMIKLKKFIYKKKITKSGRTVIKICKIPVYFKKI